MVEKNLPRNFNFLKKKKKKKKKQIKTKTKTFHILLSGSSLCALLMRLISDTRFGLLLLYLLEMAYVKFQSICLGNKL